MHSIRPFDPTDAAAVAAIASTASQIAQWSVDDYAQLITTGYLGWVSFVPESKTVTGFIVIRVLAPEAEILNIAVTPEFRESGLATGLLNAALNHLRESLVQRLYLEVRPSNTPAISFYQKHLFAITG